MRRNYTAIHVTCAALLFALSALGARAALAQATDPGVRQAITDNGPPPALAGASADELNFFQDGLARFSSVKVVLSLTGDNSGLGPRFNSNQCSSCHLQPFVGGSSPAINPLPAVASAGGATNTVPWFIVPNGPIREARFVSDGGVHDLFESRAAPLQRLLDHRAPDPVLRAALGEQGVDGGEHEVERFLLLVLLLRLPVPGLRRSRRGSRISGPSRGRLVGGRPLARGAAALAMLAHPVVVCGEI